MLVTAAIFGLMAVFMRPAERLRRATVRIVRLLVFIVVAAVFIVSGLVLALRLLQPPAPLPGMASRPAAEHLGPVVLAADAKEAPGEDAPKPGDPVVDAVIPIVMYHNTPPNFEDQLVYLEQRGYTAIDLDQALAGLRGRTLPAKPVVLTFDDGYADQMAAFGVLKRHNMRATFYIIGGGEASLWCIGAGRRYHDPLQPPAGCGDAYMNWDQVRELDRSGLITIGGHTVNHRDLAGLTADEQRLEIVTGKKMLEEQLGHGVRHFAYPYGIYTEETVGIVRAAGYVTAVTTETGEYQPGGAPLTLHRMRDAMGLP